MADSHFCTAKPTQHYKAITFQLKKKKRCIESAIFPNISLDFLLPTGSFVLLSGLRNQPSSAVLLDQTISRHPRVATPHPRSGHSVSLVPIKVSEVPEDNFTAGFQLPTPEGEEAAH